MFGSIVQFSGHVHCPAYLWAFGNVDHVMSIISLAVSTMSIISLAVSTMSTVYHISGSDDHVYHISDSVDHVYHIFDNIDHVYHISGSVDHVYQSREYFECLEDTDCRDELFLLPERVLDMDRHGGCRQLEPSPSFLNSIFALKFVFFAFFKPVSFVLIL